MLALVSATLGPLLTKLLDAALVVLATLAWWERLKSSSLPRLVSIAASVSILASCVLLTMPFITAFHESWAALLLMLSLALSTRDRILWAIVAAVLAAMFRELAAIYLVVMFGAAVLDRNRLAIAGWALAMGLVIAFYAGHAWMLQHYIGPEELKSPGWTGFGGWAFYVYAVKETSWLNVLPKTIAHALVPLAIFGWASLKLDFACRATAVMVGYAVLIACFARPVNFYWSLFNTPFVVAGIVFALYALAVLGSNIAAGAAIKKAA